MEPPQATGADEKARVREGEGGACSLGRSKNGSRPLCACMLSSGVLLRKNKNKGLFEAAYKGERNCGGLGSCALSETPRAAETARSRTGMRCLQVHMHVHVRRNPTLAGF